MHTQRGVLAGNDLWLNPMKNNGVPLNQNDPTQMYCAKLALKNNVYTFISTYQYARDYIPENDDYKINIGVISKGETSSWWIPTLISIDVVVFLSTLIYGLYIFVPWDKLKKN